MVQPQITMNVKVEAKNILGARLIYPMPLTEWVLKIVPVTKKHGTIQVCVKYWEFNKDCQKDNYPTLFIEQIIDDCTSNEMFFFMDGFFGYNQIDILLEDQHKKAFICHWQKISYREFHFGLKNVGATFQQDMSYDFYDIKHIVQEYMDDFLTHSSWRENHQEHLQVIFLWF